MIEKSVNTVNGPQDQAKPIGRALRVLLGISFIALVFPSMRAASWTFLLTVGGIIVGLLALYVMIHLGVSRYTPNLNRWLGALLALIPVVIVFSFGGARGQVSVLIFIGVSLLLAGVRADPGCEVMSIPGLIFKKNTHLACILFSPIDWLEATVFKKGAA